MKVLSLFASFVALCYGASVPVVPGHNSHYVEGESRYIWMPDGNGVPHLVDLHEPVNENSLRSAANNEYWLFTRSNPSTAQILVHGDLNSVRNSNYNPNLPVKVVVHGWLSNGNSLTIIRQALVESGDYNVIMLDWRTVAGQNYISAANGVPEVGRFLGNFLIWLFSTAGGNWNTLHLIGYSLGAHVVGNAGRTANSLPARVTGLDPAGSLWLNNENALRALDGVYVEAIHTDGGASGILAPIADADFYPNGGIHPQPGCILNICSHDRAPQFMASSIRTDHFIGRRCAHLDQAVSNACTGSTLNMGNKDTNKRGEGLYALTTGSSWPF